MDNQKLFELRCKVQIAEIFLLMLLHVLLELDRAGPCTLVVTNLSARSAMKDSNSIFYFFKADFLKAFI